MIIYSKNVNKRISKEKESESIQTKLSPSKSNKIDELCKKDDEKNCNSNEKNDTIKISKNNEKKKSQNKRKSPSSKNNNSKSKKEKETKLQGNKEENCKSTSELDTINENVKKESEKSIKNEKDSASLSTTDGKKELQLKTVGKGAKGADYDPSKSNYHPINDAFWNRGEKYYY